MVERGSISHPDVEPVVGGVEHDGTASDPVIGQAFETSINRQYQQNQEKAPEAVLPESTPPSSQIIPETKITQPVKDIVQLVSLQDQIGQSEKPEDNS